MTTDVTETTELEETPIPTGDAGGVQADAGLEIATPEPKEGEDTPTPEPEDEIDTDLNSAREAARAAAAEEARREVQEEQRQEQARLRAQAEENQRRNQFVQTYRTRIEEAGNEAYELAINAGMGEQVARQRQEQAKQRFNSHHADGVNLYLPQAQAQAQAQYLQTFNAGIAQDLGKDAVKFFGTEAEPKGYATMGEVFKAYRAIVTEGLLPEKEVEARVKRELAIRRRSAETNGQVNGARAGTQVNGTATGGLTLDGWRKLSKIERDALPKEVNQRMLDESLRTAVRA
jgi:hypothetical protein